MKKFLFFSFLAIGILTIAVGRHAALADNNNEENAASAVSQEQDTGDSRGDSNENKKSDTEVEQESEDGASPAKLNIGESDKVELHGGTVISISGQNISVGVFGLTLTVAISSSTRFVGVTDVTKIAAGDSVAVHGTIDTSTGVITASTLQDDTQRQSMISSIQQQINALLARLHTLEAELGSQR